MLRHDPAGVGATASASTASAQAALARRLDGVPLSRWAYAVEAVGTQRISVRLSYRIGGVDSTDVVRHRVMTVQGAASALRVSSDVPAPGTATDLWDEGPVRTLRVGRALVITGASADRPASADLPATANSPATADGASANSPVAAVDPADLARRADAAIPEVSAIWGRGWAQRVVVLVPGSATAWQHVTGLAQDDGVAAVSLGASTSGRPAPAAAGDVPGGQRIVVDPEAFRRLSAVGRDVVLRHEIAHLASASVTAPGMPTWLVEGAADVVGFTGSGLSVQQAAQELAALVRSGRPPAALPSDEDYRGSRASVAYEEGWLAARLITQRIGNPGLLEVYRDVATAARSSRGAAAAVRDALDGALRRRLGWDLATFTARWRSALGAQLGVAPGPTA
jgi:hypothetical protein